MLLFRRLCTRALRGSGPNFALLRPPVERGPSACRWDWEGDDISIRLQSTTAHFCLPKGWGRAPAAFVRLLDCSRVRIRLRRRQADGYAAPTNLRLRHLPKGRTSLGRPGSMMPLCSGELMGDSASVMLGWRTMGAAVRRGVEASSAAAGRRFLPAQRRGPTITSSSTEGGATAISAISSAIDGLGWI